MDISKQILKQVFSEVLKIDISEKEDEDYLLEFSITSLEFVSLIIEIETRFSICLDDKFIEIDSLNTFNKMYSIIKGILNNE